MANVFHFSTVLLVPLVFDAVAAAPATATHGIVRRQPGEARSIEIGVEGDMLLQREQPHSSHAGKRRMVTTDALGSVGDYMGDELDEPKRRNAGECSTNTIFSPKEGKGSVEDVGSCKSLSECQDLCTEVAEEKCTGFNWSPDSGSCRLNKGEYEEKATTSTLIGGPRTPHCTLENADHSPSSSECAKIAPGAPGPAPSMPSTTTTPAPPAVPHKKTVKGKPCRGNDCKSEAVCPAGYKAIKCTSEPWRKNRKGDGIKPAENKCMAFGANHRSKITAVAVCSTLVNLEVAVSNRIFLDNRKLKAVCKGGGKLLGCYCHSPWIKCGGQTVWMSKSKTTCKKHISRSGGRRRGKAGGAGAKIYAVCEKGR